MDQSGLKEALKKLGWTQKDLAARMRITPVTVSRWKTVPGPVKAYLELVINLEKVLKS